MPQAGKNLKKFAKTLYLWPHDAVDAMTLTDDEILVFDDVLWLSQWQRESWTAKYPAFAKFIHIFGNGIEPSQFQLISAKENPYSCIYASNYGRGLDTLLDIWPQIKKNFPQATLDIYYGWKHWGLLSAEKEASLKRQIQELHILGVQEHGVVGHEELARAFERTSFWTYPCSAVETFCITALKAQIAGTVPVICQHSGLTETCRNGFTCSHSKEYLSLLTQAMEQAKNISLESRRKLGDFVLQEFTWQKIAHKWKNLFDSSAKKTICLHMVIKNQTDRIAKCLHSVKDKIDSWVIVDTGASKETKDLIYEILAEIPGEMHLTTTNNPYQEALSLAKEKADYLLLIDPEEELMFSPQFSWPILDQDYYRRYRSNKEFLINSSLPWAWSEMLEKRLTCPKAQTGGVLPGVISSLEFPPKNNLLFTFVQSYIEAQDYQSAQSILTPLIQEKPSDLPLYSALYYQGLLSELLNEDLEKVLKNYSNAYSEYPNRAEPLFRMSVYAFNKNHYVLAYALAKQSIQIPNPHDETSSEDWIYEYGLVYNLANCATMVKKYEEAAVFYEKALKSHKLSKALHQEISENLKKIKNMPQKE